ncbi:sulfotransferase family protein [Roseibacterium beibuensis]|uniref:Sulfotransferase family protein n=1 Tax=[Roseibacterium] beibuensis TaxID=1193142 RepID=A0ABP9LHX8_9RHOB|nr:sulfotransferase family protein [Roseibacterium beibuensis]MCS6623215.1 sulfotransferase family protein [Roseibacterium beibuensis]
MPAFHIGEKRILFIHIPKSGGTSINAWLTSLSEQSLYQKHRPKAFPCVPQHFHGALLDTLFAPGFFDYSFCVTRNPYARILSEYNYRITRPKLKNRILPKPSFDRWLSTAFAGFARDPYMHSNHIRPQHEFLIDGTEVFKLEDGLDTLRAKLAELTGIALDAEVPRKNPSIKSVTTISEDAAEKIYRFYETDFEKFGYDKESWQSL